MKNIEAQIKTRFLNNPKKYLDISDLDNYLEVVADIGYYRFMQFVSLLHEREPETKIQVNTIVSIYDVEEKIRSFLMMKISRIEVKLRSVFSEYYVAWYGAHGYKNDELFVDERTHSYLMYKINKQLKMQPEYEVVDEKFSDDIYDLPIWSALEISTFQMLTIFYKLLTEEQKKAVVKTFEMDNIEMFDTWLEFILVVRNACAHQGILFGRTFHRKTMLPEFHTQNICGATYVLNYLLTDSLIQYEDTLEQFFEEANISWIANYYGIQ